jgi:pimeloyl-ACP methyl ester carboxylesterase
MSLTARVQQWQSRGRRESALGSRQVFVVRQDGSQAEPAIVFLHGFPSSSYDWRALFEAPALSGHDLLAFDFLGFGLSDKPAGRYSLFTQADLVVELVARHTRGPVILVAHDMGTSVASELFARELEGRGEIEIAAGLLFNGSMLLHLAKPTLGQRLLRGPAGPLAARLSSQRFFRQQFGSVFSPSHPLSSEEAADQWSLIAHLGGNRRGHDQVAYMDERVRHAERWHGAVRDWPGSLSLMWGMLDPVARVQVLRGLQALRPGVPVTELPDLGHYPQLEDPAQVAPVIAAVAAQSRPTG